MINNQLPLLKTKKSVRLTSRASFINGRLLRYDAFTPLGEKVNVFQGYIPVYTSDKHFAGYQDTKGRKVEIHFGDVIQVGPVNNDGKMDENHKSFYSIPYYAKLLKQANGMER